jgi:hypothetical protein
MLAMIVVPSLVLIWPPVARRLQEWWMDALVRTAVILLAGLVTGALLRGAKKFRDAVTLAAYAQACVTMGMVWVAFGFLVLITGRTPSKIVHERIPRSTARTYWAIGGALASLGTACGAAAERGRARGRTPRDADAVRIPPTGL